MQFNNIHRRDWVVAMGSVGMSVSDLVFAQNNRNLARAGVANFVSGDVSIADSTASQSLTSGTVVMQGHIIETGANGEVHIVFDDGGLLALRPSSRMQIEHAQIAGAFSDSLTMNLLRGAMRSITGWVGKFDRNNYQLKAATATIGIRGTDHEVAIIAAGEEKRGEIPGVHNWVREGGTTLNNAGGSTDVEPGHAAWAPHNGQAPQMHQGTPAYLQRRRSAHEARINAHAQRISEHIEGRMQRRGMIKAGETLRDAQQRHRALQANPEHPKPDAAEQDRPKASGHNHHKANRHPHR